MTARDPWQTVAETLHDRIVSGELAPGARLMEAELAEEFATSRGPVRSALQELARLGLVMVNPRRGTFVLPVSPSDIDEILSLLGVLAPFAYELACERMTPNDVARLGELVALIEGPQEDVRAWSDETLRFQRALFELAGHSRLLAIWNGLEAQVRVLARFLAEADPGEMPDAADFHVLVFEQLVRRDPRAATRLVQRYTTQMRRAITLGNARPRTLKAGGRGRRRTTLVDHGPAGADPDTAATTEREPR